MTYKPTKSLENLMSNLAFFQYNVLNGGPHPVLIANDSQLCKFYIDCKKEMYTRLNIECDNFIQLRLDKNKPNYLAHFQDTEDDPTELERINDYIVGNMEAVVKEKIKNICDTYDRITERIKSIPKNINNNTKQIVGTGRRELENSIDKCEMIEHVLLTQPRNHILKESPPVQFAPGIPKKIMFQPNMSTPFTIKPLVGETVQPIMMNIIDHMNIRAAKIAKCESVPISMVTEEEFSYFDFKSIENFSILYSSKSTVDNKKFIRTRKHSFLIAELISRMYNLWDVKTPNYKKDLKIEEMIFGIYNYLIRYYTNGGLVVLPRIFNNENTNFENSDKTFQKILFLLEFGPLCASTLNEKI